MLRRIFFSFFAVAAAVGTASAAPLLAIDFESNTAGTALSSTTMSANAGGVSTAFTGVGINGTSTATILDGTNPITVGTGNFAQVNTVSNGDTFLSFAGAAADEATSGQVELSFDFLVEDASAGGANSQFRIRDAAGNDDIQIQIDSNNFGASNTRAIRVVDNLSAGGFNPLFTINEGFEFDEATNLRVLLDLDADTISLFLNNSLAGSGTIEAGDTVGGLQIATFPNNGGDVRYYDNITIAAVTAIPEPSSLAILGMLGAVAAFRRRRS